MKNLYPLGCALFLLSFAALSAWMPERRAPTTLEFLVCAICWTGAVMGFAAVLVGFMHRV